MEIQIALHVFAMVHHMSCIGRKNKFTKDVESAIARIRTYACPPNAVRLNKSTPCGVMGKCNECYLQNVCAIIL